MSNELVNKNFINRADNNKNYVVKVEDPTILCIIPARSGSKGIVNKNIKLYKGIPLMGWSIKQALATERKMRVVVSTDSEEYAKIARDLGAETPFLRPKEISEDLSTTLECLKHCLEWLNTNENYKPDIVVLLQPTSPERNLDELNKCIEKFIDSRDKYDSLFTVYKMEKCPIKMFYFDDNIFRPFFDNFNGLIEPFNKPRQILPETYNQNGSIHIFNSDIMSNNTYFGKRMLPYITEFRQDIDTLNEWN
jgi:CMP-N-acetylneuraminic acid synthetase